MNSRHQLPGTLLALGTVATVLLGSFGCQNQCQVLCSRWYSYQNAACDADYEAVDLNRCLDDYKSLTPGDPEAQACGFYMDFVEQLDEEEQGFCGDLASSDGAFTFSFVDAESEDGT